MFVWLAVTSAPGVTTDGPMRPEIGERDLGVVEIDLADSSAALAEATSASAWPASALWSSKSCLLTALILTRSA